MTHAEFLVSECFAVCYFYRRVIYICLGYLRTSVFGSATLLTTFPWLTPKRAIRVRRAVPAARLALTSMRSFHSIHNVVDHGGRNLRAKLDTVRDQLIIC